jgi:hypothetical protein
MCPECYKDEMWHYEEGNDHYEKHPNMYCLSCGYECCGEAYKIRFIAYIVKCHNFINKYPNAETGR